MTTYHYSVTFESDGISQAKHARGEVKATSVPTAFARAIRAAKKQVGKCRPLSIVAVLDMPTQD